MGIAQGHMAKMRPKKIQEQPCLLSKAYSQPVLAVLAQEATNSSKDGLVITDCFWGIARPSCAVKRCCREIHGETSWVAVSSVSCSCCLVKLPPCHLFQPMPVVAANTHAFVHVKRFDGQMSEMLPRHSWTAAISGWDEAVLQFRMGSKDCCLWLKTEGVLGQEKMTAMWECVSSFVGN